MPATCPHCGKESTEDEPRFCSGCGARMDGKAPAGYPGYTAGISPYVLHPPMNRQKSPMTAAVCSTFLPGLGQVYNGETIKGVAIFIMFLVGLAILVIPGLIVWVFGMYNAYTTAGKMNTGEIPFIETRPVNIALFIVFAVVVIVIILVAVYYLVVVPLMSEIGSLNTGNLNNFMNTNGMI